MAVGGRGARNSLKNASRFSIFFIDWVLLPALHSPLTIAKQTSYRLRNVPNHSYAKPPRETLIIVNMNFFFFLKSQILQFLNSCWSCIRRVILCLSCLRDEAYSFVLNIPHDLGDYFPQYPRLLSFLKFKWKHVAPIFYFKQSNDLDHWTNSFQCSGLFYYSPKLFSCCFSPVPGDFLTPLGTISASYEWLPFYPIFFILHLILIQSCSWDEPRRSTKTFTITKISRLLFLLTYFNK